MGWGPLAWERRPRPEAQTPWQAQWSCQDAGDSRPPVAPAQPLQLRGICCSEQMQLGDFLCLCWLRAGGPGFSPGGSGLGPPPSQAPLRGPSPTRLHRPKALRLEAPGLVWGVPEFRGCLCWPGPLPLGPNSKHGPPPPSTAQSPPNADGASSGPGLALPAVPPSPSPSSPASRAGSRRGFRPWS